MKIKASKETIIRTAVLLLAIINNALVLLGKSPIPIDDETLVEVISFLFVVGSALVSWWYNNSFTDAAVKADAFMKELRRQKREGKHERN